MNKSKNPEEFFASIGRMMAVRMNMSQYNGLFECACGQEHMYTPTVKLLAQGKWRVVMECPDDANYLTNVEIKTGFLGFGFKRFNSISGFKCKDEIEQVSMIYAFNKLT